MVHGVCSKWSAMSLCIVGQHDDIPSNIPSNIPCNIVDFDKHEPPSDSCTNGTCTSHMCHTWVHVGCIECASAVQSLWWLAMLIR